MLNYSVHKMHCIRERQIQAARKDLSIVNVISNLIRYCTLLQIEYIYYILETFKKH